MIPKSRMLVFALVHFFIVLWITGGCEWSGGINKPRSWMYAGLAWKKMFSYIFFYNFCIEWLIGSDIHRNHVKNFVQCLLYDWGVSFFSYLLICIWLRGDIYLFGQLNKRKTRLKPSFSIYFRIPHLFIPLVQLIRLPFIRRPLIRWGKPDCTHTASSRYQMVILHCISMVSACARSFQELISWIRKPYSPTVYGWYTTARYRMGSGPDNTAPFWMPKRDLNRFQPAVYDGAWFGKYVPDMVDTHRVGSQAGSRWDTRRIRRPLVPWVGLRTGRSSARSWQSSNQWIVVRKLLFENINIAYKPWCSVEKIQR